MDSTRRVWIIYQGQASFVDANSIQIKSSDGTTTTLQPTTYLLIATGGRPHVPTEPGVQEYTITSDGFFELEQLPETVVVVGAGYIAVELAGVLNSLGSKTHLVVRKHQALRNFDPDISAALDEEMLKAGIIIHRNTAGVKQISLDEISRERKQCHLSMEKSLRVQMSSLWLLDVFPIQRD